MGASRTAPLLAVAAWFALVAAGMAAAVLHATEPPVWDALSYVQKAMTFWQAVDAGKPFNPFDLPMTIRPPGTVLMSYPLGWSEDYRWFYFRSCAIPVGLLLLAAFIGGWSRAMTVRRRWVLAALALALAGMPILYQFQSTGVEWPSAWGLVDGFLAGVAALAAAAVTRSAAQRSIGWAATAAILGAFCFLIKPAGLALMALTGTAWLAITVQRGIWTQLDDAAERRFALFSTIIALSAFSATIAAAVTSAYFSEENIAFGRRVLGVFGTGIAGDAEAGNLVRTSLGYVVPVLIAAGLFLAARRRETWGTAMAAALCLAGGLWFWLAQTELGQIRYFLPFATMTFVLLLPTLLSWLEGLSARMQYAAMAAVAAPALITTALLFAPSPAMQGIMGVNLTTNAFASENAQAEDFLRRLEAEGVTQAQLYVTNLTPAMRNVIAVASYPNLVAPTRPQVLVIAPVDWQNPNATRIEELLRSDFIAFEPTRDSAARAALLARRDVPDFTAETALLNAWLTDLTPAQGVDTISETRVRLLRVTDRDTFTVALADLEQMHQWPPSYYAANPPRWWSADDLAARLNAQRALPTDIAFHRGGDTGPSVWLRGVEVDGPAAGNLQFRFWVEADPAFSQNGWRLFLHVLDARGTVIGNHETPLAADAPPNAEKPIRYHAVAIPGLPGDATKLAFGFLKVEGDAPAFLRTEDSHADWDGRRLSVPLPASR